MKFFENIKILEFLEILDCLESLEMLENQETSKKEKRLLRLRLRLTLLTDLYKKRGACSYPRLKRPPSSKRSLLNLQLLSGFITSNLSVEKTKYLSLLLQFASGTLKLHIQS